MKNYGGPALAGDFEEAHALDGDLKKANTLPLSFFEIGGGVAGMVPVSELKETSQFNELRN